MSAQIYRVVNGRIVAVGSGTEEDPIREETVGDRYAPLGTLDSDGTFTPLTLPTAVAGDVLEWLTGHELPSTDWRIGLPPSHDA